MHKGGVGLARKNRYRKNNNIGSQATNVHVEDKKLTAAEMRDFYDKNKNAIELFANDPENIRKLTDITKTRIKAISAFNKEVLIDYLKNIGSNEKNLRNLSWYLYYRSAVYNRLINYNATMFELDARSIIPNYSLIEDNDKDKMLKSYYDTAVAVNRMNLKLEFLKVYLTCFIQDVFYGVVYYDETGLFIMPINPDYCKIAGKYMEGDFAFAMDMRFFAGSNEYLLDYWGEPFVSMYREYQNDMINNRWQLVPEEYSCCLKKEISDWQTIVPPYSGIFAQLISLEDVLDIQDVADEQEIYKLIWLELETITGSKRPDDWKVDPSLVIAYFNRLINEALPAYTSAAIVPGQLKDISFNTDRVNETNKVAKTTESVLNSSGGAQILNSATISGTTAFHAALHLDTQLATASLLPQTQSWLNRFLKYYVTDPCKVKFFAVSSYTRDEFRKELLENAQYGLSTKLAINTLSGISELDSLALNYFEEDVLELSERFSHPLASSYTTSNDDSVKPTLDDDEISTEGEASRDKRDKMN